MDSKITKITQRGGVMIDVGGVLLLCLRWIRTSCRKTICQSEITAVTSKYTSTAHDTQTQTLKCKEKTTFCLCFLRDMNIRFLCLSLQECLQQGWHRDTVLKRWVSSKEPEPRNSNGVVLLTYWFFWSFPGRAYWSWTHWSCRTTRTCADSSESEFQFWNIQHSSTDITITNIYYSDSVHFLSDWVTLCSHENNFTGC